MLYPDVANRPMFKFRTVYLAVAVGMTEIDDLIPCGDVIEVDVETGIAYLRDRDWNYLEWDELEEG